jgi:ferrochelatase
MDVLRTRRSVPELRTVRDYHDEPAYISALAASVKDTWKRNGRARHLLISFHGIPQSYADAGDPYPIHCEQTARLLAEELDLDEDRWSMAYQSRLGRKPWLGPATDTELQRLAEAGAEELEVICPGFAADCLETLEEIAEEGRKTYLDAGGSTFRYIPALNDRAEHVAALVELIRRQL